MFRYECDRFGLGDEKLESLETCNGNAIRIFNWLNSTVKVAYNLISSLSRRQLQGGYAIFNTASMIIEYYLVNASIAAYDKCHRAQYASNLKFVLVNDPACSDLKQGCKRL